MKTPCKIITFITLIISLNFFAACASPLLKDTSTPQPPGTISGKVFYEDLTNDDSAEPMPDVMIALCQVLVEGLPEGPTVAASNRGKTEHICTLQGEPTALSSADGTFKLEGVFPGTYLVLFHLFPAKVEAMGGEWNGVALTEAAYNEIDGVIPSSEAPDFWENGGPAIALANWSADEGMIVSRGNVCSNKLGFCFSIIDERSHPVIEVEPNKIVEIDLTAHFAPEEQ